jgi:hypothetical protein
LAVLNLNRIELYFPPAPDSGEHSIDDWTLNRHERHRRISEPWPYFRKEYRHDAVGCGSNCHRFHRRE